MSVTKPINVGFVSALLVAGTIVGCAADKPPTIARHDGPVCAGFMARRGLDPTPICVIPYADAGKSCNDKADCIGRCIVRLSGDQASQPTASTGIGRCEAEHETFGCFAEVKKGQVQSPALCVD